MKKKIIALTLIFAMLVPFAPAAAAEETAARPTVEEILSQYHQAAFEAEMNGEESAAYSPRSGSNEPTLEQQTVETLNEAGYEAYNVTADNYETLEDQLQTDFADMGLDPEGSYIIVIHGEEEQSQNGNARLGDLILPPHLRDDGYGTTEPEPFTYVHNGTTYTMRFMVVTSNDNTQYRKSSNHNLLTSYGDAFLDRLLETGATVYLDALNKYIPFGTIASIIGVSDYLDRYKTSESALSYFACTQWTRSYIQVWNTNYEEWRNASCAEYVKMTSKISGYLYDCDKGYYKNVEEKDVNTIEYSDDYFNYEQRKLDAVVGYILHDVECDVVGGARYQYGGTTIAYHHQNF